MDTLWDRTKHTFEKILAEGEKAAERMVESVEGLGDAAKARIEKARLERALFKRFAELGNAVYELHKAPRQSPAGEAPAASGPTLEDSKVKGLLEQVAGLEEELKKAEGQLGRS